MGPTGGGRDSTNEPIADRYFFTKTRGSQDWFLHKVCRQQHTDLT